MSAAEDVLVTLAKMGGTGSLSEIERASGWSRSGVVYALNRLADKGLIEHDCHKDRKRSRWKLVNQEPAAPTPRNRAHPPRRDAPKSRAIAHLLRDRPMTAREISRVLDSRIDLIKSRLHHLRETGQAHHDGTLWRPGPAPAGPDAPPTLHRILRVLSDGKERDRFELSALVGVTPNNVWEHARRLLKSGAVTMRLSDVGIGHARRHLWRLA